MEAEIDVVRTAIGRKATRTGQEAAQANSACRPRWDGRRGNLWFGHHLCKHFPQPEQDECLVLAAFEKEGWPGRIHDPLPSKPDADARQRLADKARRLNEQNPFLRFELDAASLAMVWAPQGAVPHQAGNRH